MKTSGLDKVAPPRATTTLFSRGLSWEKEYGASTRLASPACLNTLNIRYRKGISGSRTTREPEIYLLKFTTEKDSEHF